MPFADVIIYSFHYLLDPKIAEQVSKEMSKEAIVVFDEAHNIGAPPHREDRADATDNVCIESLSIDLTNDTLKKASDSVTNLDREIERSVVLAPRRR